MSDGYKFPNVSLHVRHVPDYDYLEGSGGKVVIGELPGNYEVGVELDGVFVPLLVEKAGRIDHALAVGKAKQQAEQHAKQQAQDEEQAQHEAWQRAQQHSPGEQPAG